MEKDKWFNCEHCGIEIYKGNNYNKCPKCGFGLPWSVEIEYKDLTADMDIKTCENGKVPAAIITGGLTLDPEKDDEYVKDCLKKLGIGQGKYRCWYFSQNKAALYFLG